MEKIVPASEQKYHHLFENLFDAVILADSINGRLLEANKKAEELLGYTRDEIIGMKQSQLHPPGKAEEYQQWFAAHAEQGHAADYEGEVVRKDGSIIPVYISAAPFTADGENMIMGVFRDITQQKRAEEALKEERDKAKKYLDIAGVIILATNSEGYVTLINRKGCEVLGYQEEKIIGKNWFDNFIPPGIKSEVLKVSEKLLTGEIEPPEYYENPVLTKSGEERLIAWHNTVLLDEKGNITGHLSSGEDITERRRAEEALKDNEDRYKIVTESSPVGIYIFQDDGWVFVNAALEKITGYTKEELLTIYYLDLVTPDFREVVKKATDQAMTGNINNLPASLDISIIRKDKTICWVNLIPRLINYQGRLAILGNLADITERKQAEDELRWKTAFMDALVQSSSDGIMVVDETGKRILQNQRNIDMFKIPADISEPGDINQLQYVTSLTRNAEQFYEKVHYLQTNRDETSQDEIELKDGRFLERYSYPALGEDGTYYGRIWTFHDITKRKKTEEALKESEERHRAMFQHSPNTMVAFSPEGAIVDVNNAARVYGYSREELLTMNLEQLTPLRDWERVSRYFQLALQGNTQHYELNMFNQRGEDILLDTILAPIIIGGQIRGVYSISRNITPLRQAQIALQLSEENFRNSLENSPFGVLIANNEEEPLYVNRALLDIYGYQSVEEFQSVPFRELFTSEGYAEIQSRRGRREKGEYIPAEHELSIKRKNGEIRRTMAFRTEVLWNGLPQSLIFFLDVTERRQTEEALRLSEENFRNSIDSSPLGIFIISDGEETLYINRTLLDIYGYDTREELRGIPISKRFTPESYAEFQFRQEQRQRGEHPEEYEVSIVRKNGEFRHLAAFVRPVLWDGKPQSQVLYLDITERRRAEEALKKSEQSLREAQALGKIGNWEFDLATQKIEWSDEVYRLYERDKALGPPTAEEEAAYYPPEDAQRLREFARLAVEKGQEFYYDLAVNLPGGNTRLFSASMHPVQDEAGQVIKLVGTVQDITERKRMEEALQKSEENFRNSLDSSPMGIVIATIDSEVLYVNRAIMDIYGYSNIEEFKNTPLDQRFTPESYAEFQSRLDKVKRDEYVSPDYEINIVRKDGEIRHLMAVPKEVLWNGERQFQVIYQDITERRRTEELRRQVQEYEELDKLKTAILSTVSHELRTPLATIKGYASMLLKYDNRLEVDEKYRYLQSIDNASERLADLVNHLLDMSRLDAGLLRMEKTPTRVSDLVKKAVYEAQLTRKHIIRLETGKRLPAISLDSRRIRQVVDNLIDNACKYSAEGTEVLVEARRKEKEVIISVSDHGIGIPESETKNVFARMYRIEQRLMKDPGGLGLGLSLCKGLVEAHGGRIWAESKLGMGSKFCFTIPVENKIE